MQGEVVSQYACKNVQYVKFFDENHRSRQRSYLQYKSKDQAPSDLLSASAYLFSFVTFL